MELDLEKLEGKLKDYKEKIESNIQEKLTEQSDAANAQVEELKTQLTETTDALKAVEESLKAQKQLTVPGLKEELKKNPFSWSAFVFAALNQKSGNANPWAYAEYEKEIIDEYAKIYVPPPMRKDAIAGDGTQGGYLIPEEVTSEVIGMVIANMPVLEMGCTIFNGLYGDLPIPRHTARNTGYWVGETEAPTQSNVAFEETTLRPKKAGAFTKFSRRLSYQTRGTADTIIKQSVADSLALLFDQAYLSGTGSDSQPKGILNAANLALMTTTPNQAANGARFRIDKAASMVQAIDVANELKIAGNYGFIMRPEVQGGMRRERIPQFTAQPIGQGMPLSMANVLMSNEQLEQITGYKIRTTTNLSAAVTRGTNLTCSYVIFGNWKQFLIGFWRDMRVDISSVASDASGNSAFLKDQFFLVAFQETDCQLGRGTAFTYVDDAQTAEASWVNG